MLGNELETLKKELEWQTSLAQEHEGKVSHLQKANENVSLQLSEAQQHCQDLVAVAKGDYAYFMTVICFPSLCLLCACLLMRLTFVCHSPIP